MRLLLFHRRNYHCNTSSARLTMEGCALNTGRSVAEYQVAEFHGAPSAIQCFIRNSTVSRTRAEYAPWRVPSRACNSSQPSAVNLVMSACPTQRRQMRPSLRTRLSDLGCHDIAKAGEELGGQLVNSLFKENIELTLVARAFDSRISIVLSSLIVSAPCFARRGRRRRTKPANHPAAGIERGACITCQRALGNVAHCERTY
jgi:hypothetical protein